MLGKQETKKSFADYLLETGKKKNRKQHFLEKVNGIINWKVIEHRLFLLYPSDKGRPSYPPLLLFKVLLLQSFYNLSDPGAEEAITDRISFRKFLGLSLGDEVPDETTIVRFRQRLLESKSSEFLFNEVNRQLKAKRVAVNTVTLVDATLIESAASSPRERQESKDDDSSWTSKGGKAYFGYKGHIAVDEKAEMIERAEFTTAKVHDSQMLEQLIPEDATAVYADKAYASEKTRVELKRRNIYDGILHKAVRNRALNKEQIEENKINSRIRCSVERVFAHLKMHFGYWRVRYFSLAKNAQHFKILAMAYNLKRATKLIVT